MPISKWKLYVEVRRDRFKELEQTSSRLERLLKITIKAWDLIHRQSEILDETNKQLNSVANWFYWSAILNIMLSAIIVSLI